MSQQAVAGFPPFLSSFSFSCFMVGLCTERPDSLSSWPICMSAQLSRVISYRHLEDNTDSEAGWRLNWTACTPSVMSSLNQNQYVIHALRHVMKTYGGGGVTAPRTINSILELKLDNALFRFSVLCCTVSTHFHRFASLATVRFKMCFFYESHVNCSWFPDFKPGSPKLGADAHNTEVRNMTCSAPQAPCICVQADGPALIQLQPKWANIGMQFLRSTGRMQEQVTPISHSDTYVHNLNGSTWCFVWSPTSTREQGSESNIWTV